jgi:integrase
MHQDTRKALERVLQRAGTLHVVDRGRSRVAQPGDVRTKIFRHTYITARLQTLDGGRQVSTYTVAREVGHSGTEMIERTYGHVAEVRHRAKVVEFRVQQHRKALGQRLQQLRSPLLLRLEK